MTAANECGATDPDGPTRKLATWVAGLTLGDVSGLWPSPKRTEATPWSSAPGQPRRLGVVCLEDLDDVGALIDLLAPPVAGALD
jgi:hypothetical protein